jgi:MOSC domain-containing protein YiiM
MVLMPRLISVNVGIPHELGSVRGRKVSSSIDKQPVDGPVTVKKLNLEGDRQADLTVHGGEYKAVYVYPSENYPFWRTKFPNEDLTWGSFGENLTTEGLLEDSTRVGDRFIIGSAEFEVTQPRMPCYKLGLKFGTSAILKLFLESGRTGFYLRVVREGSLRAGDAITVIKAEGNGPTITETVLSQADE